MHFLFNLLRINVLYMFRALLDHPQEAQKQSTLGILHAVFISWLNFETDFLKHLLQKQIHFKVPL
jgi:hypothetical protein